MLGGEFGEVSFAGVVAMCAIIIAAICDGQIHAIGGGWTRAERHVHFELKIVNGATHLFEERGKIEEVAKLSIEWFKKYLK